MPHVGVQECVRVLGEACVEAADVARHDGGAGVGPGLQVWYRVTWVSQLDFLGFSLFPQSVGCPGPLDFY